MVKPLEVGKISSEQMYIGVSNNFRKILKEESKKLGMSMSAYSRLCMQTGRKMLLTEDTNEIKNLLDER